MDQDAPRFEHFDGVTVTIELPCPRCEYSLLGRRIDQDCPECGKPIREAIPKGEKVYFFWLPQKGLNPIFKIDIVTVIITGAIATLGVFGVLFLMIRDPVEFSVYCGALLFMSAIFNFTILWSNWKKYRNFMVVLGEEELWHSREIKPMGKIRFSEITKVQQCESIGLAVIAVRSMHQCDIPFNIEGYGRIVETIQKAHPVVRMSWLRWLMSDVFYVAGIVFMFMLVTPAIFAFCNWTKPIELGALLLYVFAVNVFVGYIQWRPTRSFDPFLTAIGLGPSMAILVWVAYMFARSL